MHPLLSKAQESLEELASDINSLGSDKRTFAEIWGWNCPALTIKDLVSTASNLSEFIDRNSLNLLDNEVAERIELIPSRIAAFKKHTMGQIWGGNNAAATSAYMSLIEWITATLAPLSSWEALQDNKMLPAQLNRRLRSIQADIEEIVPKTEGLQEQIKTIQEAREAAESLPIDLSSLRESRAKVNKFSTDSAELYGKIDTYLKDSASHIENIRRSEAEAESLVRQCEEAYRITTSTGLAGAFDERAKTLYRNLIFWVFGLLAALVMGGLIGASRFETMSQFLTEASSKKDMHWGLIWMEFVLSVIGLAAPIWFAWLATKQIRQYFVLAEDYSFKASVAKAYEGYRREAARIDSTLEARLFSSALTRLEEAPLRLVGDDLHASPWQEFFNSPAFHKALESIPDLKADFVSLAKQGISKMSMPKLNGKPASSEEELE